MLIIIYDTSSHTFDPLTRLNDITRHPLRTKKPPVSCYKKRGAAHALLLHAFGNTPSIGATAESAKQRLLLQKAALRLQGFNIELHVWIYGNRKQIGFDGFINFVLNIDIALEHAPIEQQAR